MTAKAKDCYFLTTVCPKSYTRGVEKHRFLLTFDSYCKGNGKSVAIIQMNSSTAGPRKQDWKIGVKSHFALDSTLGKALCWCHKHRFDRIHFLNLFSYVDPNPRSLANKTLAQLNKPENDSKITEACANTDYIILAYGDCIGVQESIVDERLEAVRKLLSDKAVYHVGELTQNGNPRHGRSWNDDPQIREWTL